MSDAPELGALDEESLFDDGRPETGETEQLALPSPGEEWQAGAAHWAGIVGLLVALWWLFARGSSSGGSSSGRVGGKAAASSPADAEELRRKRLDAALSRSAASASAEPAAEEGVRRRPPQAAGTLGQAAPVATSKPEQTPVPSSDQPPAKVVARSAAPTPVATTSSAAPKSAAAPPAAEKIAPVAAKAAAEATPSATEAVPEAATVAKPNPTPAKEEESSPAPVPALVPVSIPVLKTSFQVGVQGTVKHSKLCKRTLARKLVGDLTASSTVAELQELVVAACVPGEDVTTRLFFKAKELKSPAALLGAIGISSGADVLAMFTATSLGPAAGPEAPVSDDEDLFSAPRPKEVQAAAVKQAAPAAFSVRAQGTFRGNIETHTVEGIVPGTTVIELEEHFAAAFDVGDDTNLRLFHMGRELKDGATGLKAGATIQVMFVPIPAATKPRRRPTARAAPQATAAGTGAILATTAASALPVVAPTPATPAEAWQAMAELEVQLGVGATDGTEDPLAVTVRAVLGMLTHDSNPAMVNTAQMMVPDLAKIWSFEPTRDHLVRLLHPEPPPSAGAGSSSSQAAASPA